MGKKILYLSVTLLAACFVYAWANREILSNPYLINDDVRQQIYWMQSRLDPELFRDDPLTRYAREYVPWGVQAVYWAASWIVEPVTFSNILAGILYVLSAGFVYGIGLRFHDNMIAVCAAVSFFLCAVFLYKIAGGLSRGFAVSLLAGYLYFLSGGMVFAASMVVLAASLLNPYMFLLLALTQGLYTAVRYGPALVVKTYEWVDAHAPGLGLIGVKEGLARYAPPSLRSRFGAGADGELKDIWVLNIPILPAALVVGIRYVLLRSPEFGGLVGWSQMAGRIEYTAAGRYELVPVPSLLYEALRPWYFNLFVGQWPVLWGLLGIVALTLVVRYAMDGPAGKIDWSGFGVFGYLLPASLILYGVACVFPVKLFVPRRYIEYSLSFLYCVSLGVCLKLAIHRLSPKPAGFWAIIALLVLLSAMRLHNTALHDYSQYAGLFRFLRETPKDSLIAGHPETMDSIPTFARRKVFVNYELSHTWMEPYWSMIKKRTRDLFKAYYASDPVVIRRFCRENGITHIVVRERDFSSERLKAGGIYFEPFDAEIRRMVDSRADFVLLNEREFPRVYQGDGIFVTSVKH